MSASGSAVSDATARAVLLALAECDSIGVAIVAPPRWEHVLASAAYESVLDWEGALGKSIVEIAPACAAMPEILDDVARSGMAAFLASIEVGSRTAGRHASLALLPLTLAETTSVLVIAQDVTERFKEWRSLDLSVRLAADLAAGHDLPGTIHAATSRAAEALDASRVSIFLANRSGTALEGAFRERDATRVSGGFAVDTCPNVRDAIDAGASIYLVKADARGAERAWFRSTGIAATLCVPLICAHEVLGVMFFDFETAVPEARLDVVVAKGLADQCASALAVAKANISASALRVLWALPTRRLS